LIDILSFSYDIQGCDSFNKEYVLEEACNAIAEVSFIEQVSLLDEN